MELDLDITDTDRYSWRRKFSFIQIPDRKNNRIVLVNQSIGINQFTISYELKSASRLASTLNVHDPRYFNTGNYTCHRSDDSSLSVSQYVFISGKVIDTKLKEKRAIFNFGFFLQCDKIRSSCFCQWKTFIRSTLHNGWSFLAGQRILTLPSR